MAALTQSKSSEIRQSWDSERKSMRGWIRKLVFPKKSYKGFPGGSDSKESALWCRRHPGLIPGSGRCSGVGHGNPFQYSCLEKPMDRGAWRATVHGAAKRVRHDLATKQQHSNWPLLFHNPIILTDTREPASIKISLRFNLGSKYTSVDLWCWQPPH